MKRREAAGISDSVERMNGVAGAAGAPAFDQELVGKLVEVLWKYIDQDSGQTIPRARARAPGSRLRLRTRIKVVGTYSCTRYDSRSGFIQGTLIESRCESVIRLITNTNPFYVFGSLQILDLSQTIYIHIHGSCSCTDHGDALYETQSSHRRSTPAPRRSQNLG